MSTSYGINYSTLTVSKDLVAFDNEAFERDGFCVLENVISQDSISAYQNHLDQVERLQVDELGKDALTSLGELHTVRLPLAYDRSFLKMAQIPAVIDLVKYYLGDFFVLHLQNGVLTRPHQTHHQAAWHRDLPYQHWVCSKPLAISALVVLDDFTEQSGATLVIPSSHRWPNFPSTNYVEKHQRPVTASSGSVIVFDSMLYHKAGLNLADYTRRAVNHVYTIPPFQQQICIPSMLGNFVPEDQFTRRLLGYETQISHSVVEYRKKRLFGQGK